MFKLNAVTLEVLKPSELQVMDLLKALEKAPNVARVEITLTDFERSTDTLKVTIEGQGLAMDKISRAISESGGVVQNVQHVLGERQAP